MVVLDQSGLGLVSVRFENKVSIKCINGGSYAFDSARITIDSLWESCELHFE